MKHIMESLSKRCMGTTRKSSSSERNSLLFLPKSDYLIWLFLTYQFLVHNSQLLLKIFNNWTTKASMNFAINQRLKKNLPIPPSTIAIWVHCFVPMLYIINGPPESPLQDPWVPITLPAQRRLFWKSWGSNPLTFFFLDAVVSMWVWLHWLKT